jgi:hypothetical protein
VEAVLDPVEVLDEQIATPWLLTEKLPYLRQRRGIDGPAPDLSLFLDGRDVHTESLVVGWAMRGRSRSSTVVHMPTPCPSMSPISG